MPRLADLQSQFLDYLSGNRITLAESIMQQGKVSVQTRLNIYKNAYQIRLKQALETDHELLGIYLGDELFDQMVEGYTQLHPSHSTSLRYFGESLPDYLKNTAPFNQHPILAEIASFERSLMYVFDAEDAEHLLFSELQNTPPELWPTLRFTFHPSVQIFDANWNSVESWKALKNEQTPPTAIKHPLTYWLLWRSPEQLSEFRPLAEDEYRFLTLAIDGQPFASMCESMVEAHEASKISAISIEFLSRWFEQGLIHSLHTTAT